VRRNGGRARLLIGALLAPVVCAAAEFDYKGSNQLRLESYGASGNDTASPYFAEGFQAFDTFQLDFSYRHNRYSRWNGQLSFLGNDSDYRSQGAGVVCGGCVGSPGAGGAGMTLPSSVSAADPSLAAAEFSRRVRRGQARP